MEEKRDSFQGTDCTTTGTSYVMQARQARLTWAHFYEKGVNFSEGVHG